ncbi:MAG TPA: DNA polymerase I [Bacteroidales bacterium]|nr:DNA polymerase I [Bacteroidales bacterium]HQG36960.1 DNA polymerase I [Bacteroidales bacterium]HQG52196.1 DNA polymerase I [Bacteroidales bacterium]HQJ19982.1 DNA polymerase I [Bacteroidales bacterium]
MPETGEIKLFLFDAYALIFRSYYAFLKNPRITSKGLNTSAIFGFLLTLQEVLQKEKPTHLAVVFDMPGPTFRQEIFPEYKATREETPEDIRKSIPYIKRLIEAFNIPIIEYPGYEADDIIGTLARKAAERGFVTYIMTPDKDLAQLVSDKIFVYKPSRNGAEAVIWGVDDVKREFGVERPEQVIDILGLMGDTSDNIPGAPGIGPKTAMKLISQFGSVEELFKNTDKLQGKLKEIIEANKEQIELSKKLATIIVDAPVELDEDKLKARPVDTAKLKELFEELEFKTTASRILESEAVKKQPFEEGKEMNETNGTTKTRLNIETVPHSYRLVQDIEGLKKLVAELRELPEFCFDTETTSINALDSELVAISVCWKKGEGYLIYFPESFEQTFKMLNILKPEFEKDTSRKIGQNMKFDIQVLSNYGLEVNGPYFDTMIAHYILEPDMKHNMDFLAETYLSYIPVPIEKLIGEKGKNQKTMKSVPVEIIVEYAVEDADVTLQLKEVFEPRLEKEGMARLARDIEMPLIKVLASMEKTGVKLNEENLKAIAVELREDIVKLENEIYKLAGTEFNISSPKQLGDILFLKLKLDSNARLTKTKQFVTNEESLQKLINKHPIVNKVLEYRRLKKLLSTYVETLPDLINPKTGRIHTSFNQTVAATGRLSSNNPNLQNIPVRNERGREIRKAFVPEDGHLFLSADYSQIELRIMAHLSGDENMIADFLSGQDIHAATAAKIFHVSINEVTEEMRNKAKTANFGIIYGISSFGLSERLLISRKEAKELIEDYFNSYPRVKSYMEESIRKARENGFVTTMFGRRRYIRDINSRNKVVRGNAERNAINAPIQGTAADIIKIAMVNIFNRLKDDKLEAKMILQVHDELIFEVLPEELEVLKNIVVKEMSGAASLKVPLKVDIGVGNNWLEAH